MKWVFVITRGGDRLMMEVIKITKDLAYTQVYESTRGLRFGDKAEFTGQLLEVALGPGILSRIYDGLQNDLEKKTGGLPETRGIHRGPGRVPGLGLRTPRHGRGSRSGGADWLGFVKEGWLDHRIMVPFVLQGRWLVSKIMPTGRYRTDAVIAELKGDHGETKNVTMIQRWPIKRPITAYREKPRPFRLLETGVRIFDTFNPIADGGTGFIPGPFGCGKTVLQQALSKNAAADIIIFAACGERANEVVELITEFPHLTDPRTNRKLMERTVIICNTSNMPVAAREASVYTAMTLAEYYRAMGHRVLLLADSTSRWAQALREMSNRLEELPGPDAFPMDLGAVISAFYSRAGFVYLNNGQKGFRHLHRNGFALRRKPQGTRHREHEESGPLLLLPPAGPGRPQTVPRRDPVDSYSKYLEYPELEEWLAENLGNEWVETVKELKNMVILSREANEQISILGDDSVPLDYHVTFWRGELVDFALMQQDAFDPVDSFCSLERQGFHGQAGARDLPRRFRIQNLRRDRALV